MAGISAIQRLLDNQLTSKFARSLKHSDLPEGWADNPEIVALAEDAYREMGTESPFFKAWNALGQNESPVRVTHATKGDVTRSGEVIAPFDEFNKKFGGIYTLPKENPFSNEILDTLGGMYPYEYDLFTNAKVLDFTTPPKGKKTKTEQVINGLFSRQDKKDIGESTGGGFWNPVESFYDGDLWADTDRATQNRVLEKLRAEFDADAIRFNDNPNYGWDSQSIVVFDPVRLKSTSNRGTFNPDDPNIYKSIPWAIGAGAGALALAPEEADAASYTGLKQMGDGLLDYMMKHRPEVDEDMSAGLHDLEDVFPGIYGKRANAYSTHSGADIDKEAMAAINAARGNPDAEVDIFRAVPQGVRDFNVGDWVTTSKSYAHEHGGHALNGDYDIITGKAKASDLYNPGDSIAEMGFWGLPMAGKVTRGLIPAVGAGGLLALTGADEAEAAPYQFPADKRGTVLYEPGLGSPIVDPADLLTAPIGVPTAALKAASVAAEPFISYGMDKAINGILGMFYGNEEGR